MQSSLSSLRGIGAGNEPFCAAGRRTIKSGFTLAEVLITLGIIGIVAAMTMPILIEKHQKKVTATRLKQAYSMLSQATLLAQKDYDEPKYWDSSKGQSANNMKNATSLWVEKYIIPYLSGAKVYGWKSLAQAGFKKGYVTLNGKVISNGNLTGVNNSAYIIELPNQVLLTFDLNSTTVEGNLYLTDILCRFDINGKQKQNMWGRDLFMFYFDTSKGKWLPYGLSDTRENLLKSYCTKSTEWGNIYCSAVIMQDGWEIKDDYPW